MGPQQRVQSARPRLEDIAQQYIREHRRMSFAARRGLDAVHDRSRLTQKAVAAAKPRASEYTLWDGKLAHFGVRMQPSGVWSFIVRVRVDDGMRKFTFRRFPDTGLADARKEATALIARVWTGETVPERQVKAPLFRDFAATYRERRWRR